MPTQRESTTASTEPQDQAERPGYKKTKLGWIPEDWSTPTISEVFKFLRTTSFSRSKMNYAETEGTYCIHYGDIHATYQQPILDFNEDANIPRINDDVKLPANMQLLKNGDLIIADASEDYEGIGSAIEITNLNGKKALSGLHTFAFRDIGEKTIKGFRSYIFKNPQVKKVLKTIATGSKVYGVSKGNLEKFRIVLPPLPEQQKIAKILSTWDNAIAKQEQLIVAKETLKKGLMQILLTGKKRFEGFEGEWEEVRLGKVADIDKNNLKSTTDSNYSFKYISLSDVDSGIVNFNLPTYKFLEAPSRARRIVKIDSVIMATVRPNLQAFAIIKEDTDGLIASTGFAVIDCKESLTPNFLIQYLFSKHITNQIKALIVGTNYPAINSAEVKNLKLKLPSLQEQKRIALVLSEVNKEIELLKQQRDELQDQKRGLMQRLLTGAVRVKVDNK